MCNIAGYTGSKQAAPILIEMIKRQEKLDGGLSTGIATIHNGKIYTAKVTGDADELIKSTDAMNFPGTVGIIHSRPDNNYVEYAHPFISADKTCALVIAIGKSLILSLTFPPLHTVRATFTAHGVPSLLFIWFIV